MQDLLDIPDMYGLRKEIRGNVLLELSPPEQKLYSMVAEYNLTSKEKEVVMLVIQGLSNKEIAEHLCITEQTVKDHLHHVFGKMSVRRRSELAAKVLGINRIRT